MATPAAERIFNNNQAFWWDAARDVQDDFTYPLHQEAPHPRSHDNGKKTRIISQDKRGYYVRSRPAGDDLSDIALDATIRSASLHQRERRTPEPQHAIIVKRADLMRKVRIRKASNLILFLVDLSWSMAVTQRMSATKGAILSILTNAYQHRDRVGLITFQKDEAKIVLPPTHSVMLAERSMKNVPIGGKTPLAAGLLKAYQVMSREKKMNKDTNIQLIILTDGGGNVSISGGDPMEDSRIVAEKIAAEGFNCIVVNTEQITFDQGFANLLAKQLNAPCHLIANIKADSLLKTINQ